MNPSPSGRKGAVLITGVSSGIGLGMVRKFVREGYRVFGSVRSEDKAQHLRSELGQQFVPLTFDVRDQAQIEAAEGVLREVLAGGRLTALINNAGEAEIGPLLHVPPEDVARQLDVLVVGQLRVTQTFFKHLLGDRPGRIINISSVSGVGVNQFFGAYAAGKHALEGLSKTLRAEIGSFGVKVVVIAPGNIATDIWPKQRMDLIQRYRGTSYFAELERAVRHIETDVAKGAMTVDEFTDALYRIFREPNPAERYTIVKRRRRRVPFSRFRLRVIAG